MVGVCGCVCASVEVRLVASNPEVRGHGSYLPTYGHILSGMEGWEGESQ